VGTDLQNIGRNPQKRTTVEPLINFAKVDPYMFSCKITLVKIIQKYSALLNYVFLLDCGNPKEGTDRKSGWNGISKSRKHNIPRTAATSYSTENPVGRTI
jgi:hypothetical protein